ncbi:MAG TPA: GTPase ObgE [Verrucomicrobiales bacterium]|nr:GTPase ObgE [Pedosphaera sp.]MAN30971.1 GTPase ObgE [Pedosphaera sp.]MEC7903052.1 GTPase ObgE [Verrucomicrobiota bacterium]HCB98587.1 GTPase ObgE [Verrucomicrobiales bacterium]
MFVDSVKIVARAGHGGNGCVALLREAFRPKGGPCGGDGGRGGDIVLEACHDINNLIAQYYSPRIVAKNGLPGQGKGKTGKSGPTVVVKVPCGTTIWRLVDPETARIQEAYQRGSDSGQEDLSESEASIEKTGATDGMIRHQGSERAVEIDLEHTQEEETDSEPRLQKELAADLVEDGQRFVLCRGGKGGLGNQHFANSKHQTPRFAQPGQPGDEGTFLLELRILAEIGLVGYPNAGKSTLLTAISKARPKIAPYPFTTLHPQIGVLEFSDYHRITVCDIPGLIDGAHQNVGLGHAFLRHIQRCRALVLLIDMAGTDARKPWDDFKQLRKELELYDPKMLEKPYVVAANKMDMEESQAHLRSFKRRLRGVKVIELAAAFDEGVSPLKDVMRAMAAQSPQEV